MPTTLARRLALPCNTTKGSPSTARTTRALLSPAGFVSQNDTVDEAANQQQDAEPAKPPRQRPREHTRDEPPKKPIEGP
jgi:hypothetical protein